MRFIITSTTGPGAPGADQAFSEQQFADYMRYNEELHAAGVLIAAEGLCPVGGARVAVQDGRRVVLDGPFAESKELVGGFYLIEVPTLEEAIPTYALRPRSVDCRWPSMRRALPLPRHERTSSPSLTS